MADRNSQNELMTEVETIIRPFKHSNGKPPFSCGQLIVIALLGLSKDSDSVELWSWVCGNFRYYEEIGILRHRKIRRPYLEVPDRDVFYHDLPIKRLKYDCVSPGRSVDRLWSLTSTIEARHYLRNVIARTASSGLHQAFRFLDLSSEIRCQIYKMALCFPLSGVRICPPEDCFAARALIVSRDLNHDDTALHWRDNRDFQCFDLQEHLALLSVNRKVSQEAIGVFYSANTFFCIDRREYDYLLDVLPWERRKCLKSIAIPNFPRAAGFSWDLLWHDTVRTFSAMAVVGSLRHLTLVTSDDQSAWSSQGGEDTNVPCTPTDELLMNMPTSLYGLTTITLIGPCSKIAAYLRAKIKEVGSYATINTVKEIDSVTSDC